MASQVKAHPFVDLHARFLRHGAADETKEDVARRMDCSRQVRSMEGNNNNTIESVGVLRLTEYYPGRLYYCTLFQAAGPASYHHKIITQSAHLLTTGSRSCQYDQISQL